MAIEIENKRIDEAIDCITLAIKDGIPIVFKSFFREKKYKLVSINFKLMKAEVLNEYDEQLKINISSYDLYEMHKIAEKYRAELKKRKKKKK